jgi:ferric-dicitrate binding protein FerR (iron transport regulator)
MVEEERIIALLQKYMEGKISGREMEQLSSLFEAPSNYHSLRPALLDIWTNNKEPDWIKPGAGKANQILNRLHYLIRLDEGEKPVRRSAFAKTINIFSKIAAILILPLLIAGTWYFIDSRSPYTDEGISDWITVSSSMGAKIKTVLPDSTVIWQNAGSIIKYPRDYTKKNRQVILSGEAFFAVHSDRLYPFYVRTNHLQVKVTGTRFDVSSYTDDRSTTVVLEKGKVGIQNLTNLKKSPYYLTPGMCYSFSEKEHKAIVKNVEVKKYISWKDGKLIFRNDPLSDVCKRLRRWYNAEIELSDNTGELLSHPFTMTIETETLSQVMDYLCQAAPVSYEIKYIRKNDESDLLRPKYIIRAK